MAKLASIEETSSDFRCVRNSLRDSKAGLTPVAHDSAALVPNTASRGLDGLSSSRVIASEISISALTLRFETTNTSGGNSSTSLSDGDKFLERDDVMSDGMGPNGFLPQGKVGTGLLSNSECFK